MTALASEAEITECLRREFGIELAALPAGLSGNTAQPDSPTMAAKLTQRPG